MMETRGRESLPNRRQSENFQVKWGNMKISASVGYYPDGRLGEVFIDTDSKKGSEVDSAARDVGLLISLALQHGCPVETIRGGVSPGSMTDSVLSAIQKLQVVDDPL